MADLTRRFFRPAKLANRPDMVNSSSINQIGRAYVSEYDVEGKALGLLRQHGTRAAQVVIELMLQAIREFDLATARVWEKVADAIDARLAAGPAIPRPKEVLI